MTPQDHHTQVPNRILDAMIHTHFNPSDTKVFAWILRKTYGWHRHDIKYHANELAEETGLLAQHVSRTIKVLVLRSIITMRGRKHVRVNDEVDEWQVQKLKPKKLPRMVEKNYHGW